MFKGTRKEPAASLSETERHTELICCMTSKRIMSCVAAAGLKQD